MGKTYLLDCTLRDGGYINDWLFGEDTIKGFHKKISQTGIEIFEVGFMKGDNYDPNKSLFPDVNSFKNVITPKNPNLKYVGMLDMSAPLPKDRITPNDGTSIDGIRVIFKKNKIKEAFEYCDYIQKQGYFISVNIVGTDLYTDQEFIECIKLFNELKPYAVSIVDTFGLIKRKQFLRLAYIADNNMNPETVLAYHAHNNLQQAFGNAEALVEMNLKRDLIIDACVFGMGRGAGNLNLELFAEYMNENYDTHYKIEPMLEIMDEYLSGIYAKKQWGYSLPYYLSASMHCHPNYAVYLNDKDSLTVKSFNEILKSIPDDDKASFSKEKAEKYYREYQEQFVDDKETLKELERVLSNKEVMILAPGLSIRKSADYIKASINDNSVVIAVNFLGGEFKPDYIFSSNMRRFSKIAGKTDIPCITTSNMKQDTEFVVNFSSYSSKYPEIIDNSGLMLLKLLCAIGVQKVKVAGMDGYSEIAQDYFDDSVSYDYSKEARTRNELISREISDINKTMNIEFVTPSKYTGE